MLIFSMLFILISKILWSHMGMPVMNKIFSLMIITLLITMLPIHNLQLHYSEWAFLDQISFVLAMMLIMLLITFESANIDNLLINSIMSLSLLTFLASDILYFYVTFELNLIPIFVLILGWGYQPERLYSVKTMMMYTLMGSLPFLLMIINFYTMSNFSLKFLCASNNMNTIFYLSLLGVFLVKLPVYSLHLWLPLAHVEAPLVGSMVLAGVLLKLGGYGATRILTNMPSLNAPILKFFIIFTSYGALAASLICASQVDMKVIIAYSSVAHMSLAVASMMTLSYMGVLSSLMVFVAHGFTSSLMFFCAGNIYLTSHSRHLMLNKGNVSTFPLLTTVLFLVSLMNAGGPPSMNLMSEIMSMFSLINMFSALAMFTTLFLMAGMYFNMKFYSVLTQNTLLEMNKCFKLSNTIYLAHTTHLMATASLLPLVLFMVM